MSPVLGPTPVPSGGRCPIRKLKSAAAMAISSATRMMSPLNPAEQDAGDREPLPPSRPGDLSPGGNRQMNRALHTVALTQARRDLRAQAFLAKKRVEGKSPQEARRALKRLASAIYRALELDLQGGIMYRLT